MQKNMHIIVNKLRQNGGLETWKWRQIVTSQTAHTKCKWPPYDLEPNPRCRFQLLETAWKLLVLYFPGFSIIYFKKLANDL